MMRNPWKTLKSKIVYETPWMKVVEDEVIRPDGNEGKYSYLETPPSVFIVALDEQKKLYLVRQFRYPTQTCSWEIPGGGSDGKNLLVAAKKELKEETGLEADNWLKVGTLQAMNGVASEVEHVFLAQKLRATNGNKQKEEGISEMKKVSYEEFKKMVAKGEITDAQSLAAFTQVELFLNEKGG